jgi:NADH:ubiquinone oxidoreductase subunit E
MTRLQQEIPTNDPLNIAEQKAIINNAIANNKDRPGAVMLVLNEVQGKIGHVSTPMQSILPKIKNPNGPGSRRSDFLFLFQTQPRGKHTIKFCLGTACYVAGVSAIN